MIAGQGSVVANAEAVADYLRETRGLKVGVLNLTMFRPFPADLVTPAARRQAGRSSCSSAPTSRWRPICRCCARSAPRCPRRWRTGAPRPARSDSPPVPARSPRLAPSQVPDFYSGCFGLGSRDLQPGDIVAAVDNMLPGARQVGGSSTWASTSSAPARACRSCRSGRSSCSTPTRDSRPSRCRRPTTRPAAEGSLAFRIHSVGGWGAITMGKNVAMTAFELFGLHVKANPKYGSEKKGQPTTFYGVLASEPVRLNCELKHVDIVLSPDANVFRHSNPLAGLRRGGVFVIQSDREPRGVVGVAAGRGAADDPRAEDPGLLPRRVRDRQREASDAELRYRMQGNAFMGAFFALSPLHGAGTGSPHERAVRRHPRRS